MPMDLEIYVCRDWDSLSRRWTVLHGLRSFINPLGLSDWRTSQVECACALVRHDLAVLGSL
jgi:hypothetical protein